MINVCDQVLNGDGSPISTKGTIHWFDSKSGDGMVKVASLGSVFFNCKTVADLTSGELVPVIIHHDSTFIQAEIDTAKL